MWRKVQFGSNRPFPAIDREPGERNRERKQVEGTGRQGGDCAIDCLCKRFQAARHCPAPRQAPISGGSHATYSQTAHPGAASRPRDWPLAGGSIALAQGASASLTGSVTDASGATVPGATVTIPNVDTNFSQTVRPIPRACTCCGHCRSATTNWPSRLPASLATSRMASCLPSARRRRRTSISRWRGQGRDRFRDRRHRAD